nr:MAG TPA: replisome organizer [Caudoviricetes sp.]
MAATPTGRSKRREQRKDTPMRIRTIKPEFWTSNDIADLSLEDRLLFIGLWSYVDDHGRGRAEAHLIIAALFPRDMFANPRETVARVSRGLSHLSDAGLIHRYEVEGAPFFAVTAWTKHQRVDKPRPSRIPSPEEADTTTIPQNDANRETVAKESRNCREGVAKPLDTSAPGTGEQGNRGYTPYKSPKGDATVAADAATLDDDSDALIDALVAPPASSSKTPKPKTSRRRRETYPSEFEAFWDAYPKKADKRAALRAWKRAVAEVDNGRLIEAARAYAADPARKPDYTKNATTWLNAGSWDNQPAEPSTPRVVSMWDYVGGLAPRNDTSGAPAQHPTDAPRTGLERPNTPAQVPTPTPRKVHAR